MPVCEFVWQMQFQFLKKQRACFSKVNSFVVYDSLDVECEYSANSLHAYWRQVGIVYGRSFAYTLVTVCKTTVFFVSWSQSWKTIPCSYPMRLQLPWRLSSKNSVYWITTIPSEKTGIYHRSQWTVLLSSDWTGISSGILKRPRMLCVRKSRLFSWILHRQWRVYAVPRSSDNLLDGTVSTCLGCAYALAIPTVTTMAHTIHDLCRFFLIFEARLDHLTRDFSTCREALPVMLNMDDMGQISDTLV